MLLAGFEPAVPASDRLEILALDRTATGTVFFYTFVIFCFFIIEVVVILRKENAFNATNILKNKS